MDKALLIRLYSEQPCSVDQLPYTNHMNILVAEYDAAHPEEEITPREAYLALMNLRKAGKLVRRRRLAA